MQAGWSGLVLIAVLFSVVASVYSLWLLKVMIFDAAPSNPKTLPADEGLSLLVGLIALVILAVGVYPAPLANLCLKVAAALL
jgi:NADH-quinone oxidoreductase subunit N